MEHVKYIQLIFVVPVITCVIERFFFVLKKFKNYKRSTIAQSWLNDVSVVNCHKTILEFSDL